MSRDMKLTGDDGSHWSLENLCTQKWLEGHSEGAKTVTAWLIDRAVQAFRVGKDEDARFLRALADLVMKEVVPNLQERAKEHAREHPERLP